MRILMCNSYYYIRGGIERCFFDQIDLLTKHGHTVIPFSMQHDRNEPTQYADYFVSEINYPELIRRKTDLATAFMVAERVIYSREAAQKITQLIADTRPHIAHIHEIADEISPSVLVAIRRAGIPIVQTLHDYKLLCPNTNFVCRGEVCERCKGFRFYEAVRYRCKRDSISASLMASIESYAHRLSRIYERSVGTFLAPSRFLQRKMIEHSFRANIIHLPHFIDIEQAEPCSKTSDYCLYFGRLDQVKGIYTLFEALKLIQSPVKLYIAGEGELEPALRTLARQVPVHQVEFLGYVNWDRLLPVIQAAAFTIFPSQVYENYPMAILESFACGSPVIGSNIGAVSELVKDGHNGLLFETGNPVDLASKIQLLLDSPGWAAEMGRNGRRQVEIINHPETYYECVSEVYNLAMKAMKSTIWRLS